MEQGRPADAFTSFRFLFANFSLRPSLHIGKNAKDVCDLSLVFLRATVWHLYLPHFQTRSMTTSNTGLDNVLSVWFGLWSFHLFSVQAILNGVLQTLVVPLLNHDVWALLRYIMVHLSTPRKMQDNPRLAAGITTCSHLDLKRLGKISRWW